MKKKISKAKQEQRAKMLKTAKKQKIILTLSAIVPFAFTIALIISYAVKKAAALWLLAASSAAWLALGGLFVYAAKKRWGYVTSNGAESRESYSVVTIYNIALIFVLGALFAFLFIRGLVI